MRATLPANGAARKRRQGARPLGQPTFSALGLGRRGNGLTGGSGGGRNRGGQEEGAGLLHQAQSDPAQQPPALLRGDVPRPQGHRQRQGKGDADVEGGDAQDSEQGGEEAPGQHGLGAQGPSGQGQGAQGQGDVAHFQGQAEEGAHLGHHGQQHPQCDSSTDARHVAQHEAREAMGTGVPQQPLEAPVVGQGLGEAAVDEEVLHPARGQAGDPQQHPREGRPGQGRAAPGMEGVDHSLGLVRCEEGLARGMVGEEGQAHRGEQDTAQVAQQRRELGAGEAGDELLQPLQPSWTGPLSAHGPRQHGGRHRGLPGGQREAQELHQHEAARVVERGEEAREEGGHRQLVEEEAEGGGDGGEQPAARGRVHHGVKLGPRGDEGVLGRVADALDGGARHEPQVCLRQLADGALLVRRAQQVEDQRQPLAAARLAGRGPQHPRDGLHPIQPASDGVQAVHQLHAQPGLLQVLGDGVRHAPAVRHGGFQLPERVRRGVPGEHAITRAAQAQKGRGAEGHAWAAIADLLVQSQRRGPRGQQRERVHEVGPEHHAGIGQRGRGLSHHGQEPGQGPRGQGFQPGDVFGLRKQEQEVREALGIRRGRQEALQHAVRQLGEEAGMVREPHLGEELQAMRLGADGAHQPGQGQPRGALALQHADQQLQPGGGEGLGLFLLMEPGGGARLAQPRNAALDPGIPGFPVLAGDDIQQPAQVPHGRVPRSARGIPQTERVHLAAGGLAANGRRGGRGNGHHRPRFEGGQSLHGLPAPSYGEGPGWWQRGQRGTGYFSGTLASSWSFSRIALSSASQPPSWRRGRTWSSRMPVSMESPSTTTSTTFQAALSLIRLYLSFSSCFFMGCWMTTVEASLASPPATSGSP
ncbi:hypothetical protein STIAU_6036 [Stigmatella aurantiaca DW4/3-1]|uniref:Uncharacterized protein n=1 Tax=Stigmatella aurantiaca (strain DW4/3-1) TaxID=378806 RepID=Q09A91_STIAD|nr:hypothetical protein STIAU_6036 [Stigmatella aurantiaca DW4/3-1]